MADSRIDELRRRLERDPGSRLFAQLAEEYRKTGNHADAIRVARTGLAQHPSYPSARLTLGRALLDSGDPGGARIELETALRDAPDNILASRFLGQALEALGDLGPALVQLQKTLKMAPGDRQLESQIVSLEARLRSPRPGPASGPPAAAAPPERPMSVAAAAREFTARPPRPAAPAPPETDSEPLPPTIRIHATADRGRRMSGPPPLPATAAPLVGVSMAAPPPVAPATPRAPVAAATGSPRGSAFEESDLAPTLPTAQPPGLVDEANPPNPAAADPSGFGQVDESAAPTLPPGAVAVEETVFEAEAHPLSSVLEPGEASPAAEITSPAGTPFSSSTLAELYLRQGLADRAVEVYRQVVAEEPGNDRARSRLAELESTPSAAEARAARRLALERAIAGLEALLAVVQSR